jgi:IS605 OrfB family transposase
MKLAGTLKVEIVKPANGSWSELGARMRALRETLPMALNLSLRDVYPGAISQLEAISEKQKPSTTWQNDVRKRLRFHWARGMERRCAYMLKKSGKDYAAAHVPPGDVLCSETSDHILSRFAGQHLKDLLAGRAGVPTFEGSGKSFFSEGRNCEVSGTPDDARLTFPFFGTGKGATSLVVAPCGGNAVVLWRQLVGGAGNRAGVVELERSAKKPLPKDATDKVMKAARAARDRALFELEEKASIKLGKVGIKFDERKRKWFALISWSQHRAEGYKAGNAVACNFGINVFMLAMSEDGTTWEDPGTDIIAMREQYAAQRRRIAKGMRAHGSGSRGRGVKRRELPLTAIGDREARRVKDRIRQRAADFARWCTLHGVSDVFMENMTGIRENFEKQTEGQAHSELKRLIHQWPYYESQQTIDRALTKVGIRTHYKNARFVSQRCPACSHTSEANVEHRDNVVEFKRIDGEVWKRVVRVPAWFRCEQCQLKASVDGIACANHLLDVGKKHALAKMQEAGAKKRGLGKKGVKTASGSDSLAPEAGAAE